MNELPQRTRTGIYISGKISLCHTPAARVTQ